MKGYFDEHTHGGFGCEVMENGLDTWLAGLKARGTTGLLAGVYTSPVPVIRSALARVQDAMRRDPPGAKLYGVHLEGPFISKRALGAMDEKSVLAPSVDAYRRITEGYEDLIKLVTLAPEEPGAEKLIEYLRSQNVCVLAGHTAATYEEGMRAFAAGVQGITHTFNASTPIKHREPGIITAALLRRDIYCEVICDFVHVHPGAVEMIYRMKGADRMIVVSDAVKTTGLPDDDYEDNGIVVAVRGGVSRVRDTGSLNGGGATQDKEVENLISIGIPKCEAERMAGDTPREFLGITEENA